MDDRNAFLKHGLAEVDYGLADIVCRANLHLLPETLRRSVYRRARRHLKALEVVLRRLILLLALSLQLAPVRPHTARAPVPLPEGVEDVTASFLALIGPQRHLALAGQVLAAPGEFPELDGPPMTGSVPAGTLIAWVRAIRRVLKNPDAAARRVARAFARIRARGEAQPYCPPAAGNVRLYQPLRHVAGGLPAMVNRELASWNDTG